MLYECPRIVDRYREKGPDREALRAGQWDDCEQASCATKRGSLGMASSASQTAAAMPCILKESS